ncbi:ATP-dependent helicase HrpB [Thiocapsa rosea]|uniref:ATP-dependent helicase HrpB n=1 Tax=Thiocapsa rosea TaxID=69360 RepID=A0A495VDB8_9GAMM|nr:ATP-dependent helicase HrpB [Thiocapsa rosea]RKT47264.1 ATP-dependent helicase HrpB [Thiocapsa rosea]
MEQLPIEPVLDDLRAALRRGHAVLQAPTGSGKSTRVPLALLDEDWLGAGRILMLQPRRPAARMIAARMAALLGEPLGERVGYQIRFERRIGPRSRIEVITEGILTRRIQSDPTLEGVGLLVFDEFHERSLQSDLGLALALDLVAGLRPDLRLLLMSATLDTKPLAGLLGNAAVIRGEGRSFPVEVHYAERASGPDTVAAVISGVRSALASHPGDILAFLPGTGEINRCVARLRELLDERTRILPLHGSLPTEEQEKALVQNTGPERRVLVSTDIAETSLTIPGIQVVIDSGLSRKPRFDPGSGLTRLVTEPIARASAEQRAGRAGRLGPGVCYRLWTRAQEQGRPEHRTPEILQADLTSLVLELRLWGVADPSGLRWVDPPPGPTWEAAVVLLTRLRALDSRGAIAPLGRRMAELPVHPRLAVMLLGAAESARGDAADLCALITERDPLLDTPRRRRPADLGLRLQALHAWRERRSVPGADPRRLAAADRVSQQLQGLTRKAQTGSAGPGSARSTAELLALAYPERIAQRREGTDGRYRLAGGSGALLPQDDALGIHPYLVIASLDAGGADGRIQSALPIAESEIRACFAERIEVSRRLSWDTQREAVAARAVERLEAITLRAQPVPLEAMDDVAGILLEQIATRFDQAFAWSDAALQFIDRVALMRRLEPEGDWPDLSPEALRADLHVWLAPYLSGMSRLVQTQKLDLMPILAARLDWGQRQRLDSEAPTRIETPAGRERAIDYCVGETPILAVQLQELFGLAETPRIGRGRVPLLLHLLSPARRPIQVTQDLAGFWARGYAEVRKELRGRYPKHAWPEDPTRATPVAGVRRPRRAEG